MRTGGFKSYLTDLYNVTDMVQCLGVLLGSVLWLNLLTDTTRQIDLEVTTFVDLEGYTTIFSVYNFLVCIVLLSSVVSTIQYVKLSPRLAMLTKSLAHMIVELPYFMFIFALLFFTYALVGHLLFGSSLEDWSTIKGSFHACWAAMIDYIDVEEIEDVFALPSDSLILFAGIVFVYSFQFLMTLTLANMLIAILMMGYETARSESIDSPAHRAFGANVGSLSDVLCDWWHQVCCRTMWWIILNLSLCICSPRQQLRRAIKTSRQVIKAGRPGRSSTSAEKMAEGVAEMTGGLPTVVKDDKSTVSKSPPPRKQRSRAVADSDAPQMEDSLASAKSSPSLADRVVPRRLSEATNKFNKVALIALEAHNWNEERWVQVLEKVVQIGQAHYANLVCMPLITLARYIRETGFADDIQPGGILEMLIERYTRRSFNAPPDAEKPFLDEDVNDIVKRLEERTRRLANAQDLSYRALKTQHDETLAAVHAQSEMLTKLLPTAAARPNVPAAAGRPNEDTTTLWASRV